MGQMNRVDEEKPNLTAPERLAPSHELEEFDCGTLSLNEWLKRRARRNEQEGASRTYVVCAGKQVVGYYCLAAGPVCCLDVPGRVRRNMPDPIPVVVIGRLAIHRDWQGQRIGRALLRDAVLRTLNAAEVAGVRAILVHAISEDAKRFYQSCSFMESPTNPMTLVVTLDDIKKALI
jgi:GNAT superfamily N-acetyltransferase